MPYTYRHATAEFQLLPDRAKAKMNLESDSATDTAVPGVFQVFRRRLTLDQSLRFADLLPAVPHAILVEDLHPNPPVACGSGSDQEAKAQALHPPSQPPPKKLHHRNRDRPCQPDPLCRTATLFG